MTDAVITFDIAAFRLRFPEFSSATAYPDASLQVDWDISANYISTTNYGVLKNDARTLALQLMTAHIAVLSGSSDDGGPVVSSSIDKISVSTLPPPVTSALQYWLATTKYGKQLNALLSAKVAGGLYVPNLPETRAFRKYGGSY